MEAGERGTKKSGWWLPGLGEEVERRQQRFNPKLTNSIGRSGMGVAGNGKCPR